MPYFDEPSRIATFSSHAGAIAAVEEGLAAGRGGARKVSRIDLPDTEQTVFGVALTDSYGDVLREVRVDDFGARGRAAPCRAAARACAHIVAS
jgi:hypothetical protein